MSLYPNVGAAGGCIAAKGDEASMADGCMFWRWETRGGLAGLETRLSIDVRGQLEHLLT